MYVASKHTDEFVLYIQNSKHSIFFVIYNTCNHYGNLKIDFARRFQ